MHSGTDSSGPEVTSTGLYGASLEAAVTKTALHGAIWSEDLTDRKKVFIAQGGTSGRLATARQQGIPCVSLSRMREGRCKQRQARAFDIAGKDVCTTGLSSASRNAVQRVCQLYHAKFCAALTQNCSVLVISSHPPSPETAGSPKVRFAAKHHIPILPLTEFLLRYAHAVPSSELTLSQASSRVVAPINGSLLPARSVQRGSCCAKPSTVCCDTSLAEDMRSIMSDVVAYATPSLLATASSRQMLRVSGCQVARQITGSTTHVVLPGGGAGVPYAQGIFLRPGLEFVSMQWLAACVARRERLPCAPYRVEVSFRPTVTFSGLSSTRRASLVGALQAAGLPIVVQDTFILGAAPADGEQHPDVPVNTTHLVVPRSEVLYSKKVSVVASRFLASHREECQVVDPEWMVRSAALRCWIGSEPFRIPLPVPRAFRLGLADGPTTSRGPSAAASSLSVRCKIIDATMQPPPAAVSQDESDGALSQNSCLAAPNEFEKQVHVADTSGDVRAAYFDSETLTSLTLEGLLSDLETHVGLIAQESSTATPTVRMATPVPWIAGDALPVTENPPFALCPRPSEAVVRNPVDFISMRRACRSTPPAVFESQFVFYYRADGAAAGKPINPSKDGDASPSASNVQKGREGNHAAPPPAVVEDVALFIAKDAVKELSNDVEGILDQLPRCRRVQRAEDCTHFITARPAKTEQFLCAVAAGKWVLMPSFLTASASAEDCPVAESLHEWSAERAQALGFRSSVANLVYGCRRQRMQSERPYANWTVVLTCSSDTRFKSFAHVLRCGGCTCVESSTPTEVLNHMMGAAPPTTDGEVYVLSDDNVWTESQLESIAGAATSHPVLRLEYLVHRLCMPSAVISDFKLLSFLRSRKRTRVEAGQ